MQQYCHFHAKCTPELHIYIRRTCFIHTSVPPPHVALPRASSTGAPLQCCLHSHHTHGTANCILQTALSSSICCPLAFMLTWMLPFVGRIHHALAPLSSGLVFFAFSLLLYTNRCAAVDRAPSQTPFYVSTDPNGPRYTSTGLDDNMPAAALQQTRAPLAPRSTHCCTRVASESQQPYRSDSIEQQG